MLICIFMITEPSIWFYRLPNLCTKVCNSLFKLSLVLLLSFYLLQLMIVAVILCFYVQLILDSLNLRQDIFSTNICDSHLDEVRQLYCQRAVTLGHGAFVLFVHLLKFNKLHFQQSDITLVFISLAFKFSNVLSNFLGRFDII